jgi:hypothetical protein
LFGAHEDLNFSDPHPLGYEDFDFLGSNANLGLLSNPPSLAISSPNLQSFDKQLVIPRNYPLSAESFEQTEPGTDNPRPSPAHSVKSPLSLGHSPTTTATGSIFVSPISSGSDHPQRSSGFSDREDTASFHEGIGSERDFSNSQNSSTIPSPQAQFELHLKVGNPAPGTPPQDANTRGVAPQEIEKPVPTRKRCRKEQQLNCPICAKVFSRPCDLK